MSLNLIILIPIFISIIIYFLSTKIKKAGPVINVLVSGYILYSLTNMYGQWNLINESLSLNILGKDIDFLLSVTPLSWLIAVMTATGILLISIFSIGSQEKDNNTASFSFFFSILFGSILGVVFAKDFFTLFIFWEIMTWSSFFIISAGKKDSAQKASYRYLLLSVFGAYLMLTALFIIYSQTGSFEFVQVISYLTSISTVKSLLLISMLGVPFLIKSGVFPFHIWVNEAHSSAPKEFSPFLSGLMLKIGVYGLTLLLYLVPLFSILDNTIKFRGLPIFNYILALFGGITIITGTILAIRQEDVKRLVAFSSISQMGYIVMALAIATPLGFSGGMLHLMNHMIFKTTIFLTIAAVIYRTNTTKMSEMGGLIFKMPVTFAAYLTAIIALAGIPPTNGFISKWVIYQALIQKGYIFLSVAAFFGSIGSFMYVFKPLSTIFLGQLKPEHKNIKEVPFTMQFPMYILMGLMVLFGVVPGIQMKIINQIAVYLNIDTVQSTLYTIEGAFGAWNSLVIFNVFVGGFILALLIFVFAKKSKFVGLMDTYTAGEYTDDPEGYHYAYKYYRPFDRIFDSFAARSLTKAYDRLAENVAKFGNLLNKTVVTGNGQTYVFYMVLVTVLLAFAGWII
ncbi:MAG: proton-conducting transporter membrane subunit [Bacillota bacterium]